MKLKRCQYFYSDSVYAKRYCNAPKDAHTFDEGCKGHRSSCPYYRNDELVLKRRKDAGLI